jgi:hypothetical protein
MEENALEMLVLSTIRKVRVFGARDIEDYAKRNSVIYNKNLA